MADKHWVATVSPADWNATASWSLTRGGASGAAVPTTGENVYVETGIAPDTNLASNTAVLGILTWTASFAMGSSSTPLEVSAATVRIRNTSFVNLKAIGTAGIRYCDIDVASSGTVALSVSSTGGFSSDGSNAGYLHINGNATLSGEICTVVGSVLRVFGGRSTMDYHATACVACEIDPGASLTFSRGISTLRMSSKSRAIGRDNAPIATGLYVEPEAHYSHESYGTIALSDVKPGGIASAQFNKYPFTLTSRVRRKNAQNFYDTSNLANTPADTGVGNVTVV